MILYIVDLEVDAAISDDYLSWLREHVEEMLALPIFTGAEIFVRLEPEAPPDTCAFVVHYRLRNHAAFERYLAKHAPRMRESGLQRWGEQVRARRSLLKLK